MQGCISCLGLCREAEIDSISVVKEKVCKIVQIIPLMLLHQLKIHIIYKSLLEM